MMPSPNPFPIIVKIDVSRVAMSYVLTARVDGEERIVSWGSKRLSQRQQKLSLFEVHTAALMFAVNSNANLLQHHDYVVETDYRPLQEIVPLLGRE